MPSLLSSLLASFLPFSSIPSIHKYWPTFHPRPVQLYVGELQDIGRFQRIIKFYDNPPRRTAHWSVSLANLGQNAGNGFIVLWFIDDILLVTRIRSKLHWVVENVLDEPNLYLHENRFSVHQVLCIKAEENTYTPTAKREGHPRSLISWITQKTQTKSSLKPKQKKYFDHTSIAYIPCTGFLLVHWLGKAAGQPASHTVSLPHSTNHSTTCSLRSTNQIWVLWYVGAGSMNDFNSENSTTIYN